LNKEGMGTRYIRTIPFKEELEYMRLSLEAYLIYKSSPENNK